jgi:hypothetical protein
MLVFSMAVEGGGADLYFVDGRYVWRGQSMRFDENDDEVWDESVSEPFDDLAAALHAWADGMFCSVPTFVEAARRGEIAAVVRGILERAPQDALVKQAGSYAAAQWQAVGRGDPWV